MKIDRSSRNTHYESKQQPQKRSTRAKHARKEVPDPPVLRANCICSCRQAFTTSDSLRRHQMRAHNTESHFECETCGKRFKHGDNLKQHIFSHREKPTKKKKTKTIFHCNTCKMSFGTKYNFGRHNAIKHGENVN